MTDKINWQFLAAELKGMDEQDILELLIDEQEGAKRPFMLRRLHQRYCTLRNQRERAEIMARTGL
jgi:hypothetical protein